MTQTTAAPRRRRRALARLATEALAPVVQIVAITFAVAVHAAGARRGLALGAVVVVFAGGLPFAVLMAGIRSGRYTDRHLSRREQRPAFMLFGLLSISVGLLFLRWLDAPRALFAVVLAMLAGVVVAYGVSLFWKLSIHSACAAGSVVTLVVLVSPWALVLAPLAAVVGWSRVELADHTVPQVVVGVAVGAVVAGAVSLAAMS
jgi:hypothetical protein